MVLSMEEIAKLDPAVLRGLLPSWVAHHVDAPAPFIAKLEPKLRVRIDAASDADLLSLVSDYAGAGAEYRLYPANPFARDLTRVYMQAILTGWSLSGGEHLDRFLTEGPSRRMIVCNHLSYTDTQLTDAVLVSDGRRDLADRLVAIAGPKVYTDPWRRMAAISLNTRKTAQSSAVATEQGALGPRELAAVAFDTIRDCERLMDEGYIVLLYPEGTRSKTGRLQPFLRAASRYVNIPGMQILPFAQVGGEQVFPRDAERMFRGEARILVGPAFENAAYPGKLVGLGEAHARLAALLPEPFRPPTDQPVVA